MQQKGKTLKFKLALEDYIRNNELKGVSYENQARPVRDAVDALKNLSRK